MEALQNNIKELTGDEAPLIILSIDEVDTLMFKRGSDVKQFGQYVTFMKALSSENLPSVYVTVQSSAGYVFDIAPPATTIDTVLKTKNTRVRTPFIELDFDVNVLPVRESQLNLQAVCTTEFITRFGRSLLVLILLQILGQTLTNSVFTGSERLMIMVRRTKLSNLLNKSFLGSFNQPAPNLSPFLTRI